ncbi:MAG: DUF3859 domain-containing protein [Candidatus Thiodiazotropha sp. (ex Monitilora ramsayi)]|nr:DUF3859 domain-containing protein [Candidatus Thiodiazotropha sp. (ex Monitilora ramsayi)]
MKTLPLLIVLISALTVLQSSLAGQEAIEGATRIHSNDQFDSWGKVTEFGLFNGLDKGQTVESKLSGTGKIIRNVTVEFAETSTRIPLRKGVYFGYRYWLKLSPDQHRPMLTRRLTHPEMLMPDGTRVTESERRIKRKATHGIVTALDLYALSEEYELVEGEWTFQIWFNGKMLVSQRFITYWPEEEVENMPDDNAR